MNTQKKCLVTESGRRVTGLFEVCKYWSNSKKLESIKRRIKYRKTDTLKLS